MEEEFEVSVADGSAESVAVDIVKIWEEVKEGKLDLILKFEGLAEKMVGKKVEVVQEKAGSDDDEGEWSDEDDEDDEDVEMEDVPQLIPAKERKKEEPEVDADGFTLVKAKGKSRN